MFPYRHKAEMKDLQGILFKGRVVVFFLSGSRSVDRFPLNQTALIGVK
jgi:hypothetical protein